MKRFLLLTAFAALTLSVSASENRVAVEGPGFIPAAGGPAVGLNKPVPVSVRVREAGARPKIAPIVREFTPPAPKMTPSIRAFKTSAFA